MSYNNFGRLYILWNCTILVIAYHMKLVFFVFNNGTRVFNITTSETEKHIKSGFFVIGYKTAVLELFFGKTQPLLIMGDCFFVLRVWIVLDDINSRLIVFPLSVFTNISSDDLIK